MNAMDSLTCRRRHIVVRIDQAPVYGQANIRQTLLSRVSVQHFTGILTFGRELWCKYSPVAAICSSRDGKRQTFQLGGIEIFACSVLLRIK